MRWLILVLMLVAAGRAEANPINPVIGDVSWHGDLDTADEVARVRAHLLYAVELLRAAVPVLTAAQQHERSAALDALASYASRGEFPRRTDPVAGRRPRFIDDRGVHCAVAFLVARADPALARTINRSHEYDYIRDIDEPALIAWAAHTGFTVDELAIIQPTYGSPPTRESALSVLEGEKARLTLFCAKEGWPQSRVELHASGDKRGVMTVTTRSTDLFARCFARMSSFKEPGRRWSRKPKPYELDVTLQLPSPTGLLAGYLRGIETPRCPTAATSLAVEVTGTRVGLIVTATTTPADPVADECFQSKLRRSLGYFENVPGISASFERQLAK